MQFLMKKFFLIVLTTGTITSSCKTKITTSVQEDKDSSKSVGNILDTIEYKHWKKLGYSKVKVNKGADTLKVKVNEGIDTLKNRLKKHLIKKKIQQKNNLNNGLLYFNHRIN